MKTFLEECKEKKDVKNIKDCISANFDRITLTYEDSALEIAEFIIKNGNGFVVDIAKKIISFKIGSKNYQLSDKQEWCLAYAFINL